MALPSFWELALPNVSWFTFVGLILIALAIFGFTFFSAMSKAFGLKPFGISLFLIFVGAILVWGVSILQDLFASVEFWYLAGGAVILLVVGYFSFKDNGSSQQVLKL